MCYDNQVNGRCIQVLTDILIDRVKFNSAFNDGKIAGVFVRTQRIFAKDFRNAERQEQELNDR